MSLSVIIPVYNEQECINHCLLEVEKSLRDVEHEIIIINDGSTDRSDKIIKSFIKDKENLIYLSHMSNRGYGQALRTGFLKASKTFVSFIDADLQYRPSDMLAMYHHAMSMNHDFIIGKPRQKYYSKLRTFISKGYNLYLSFLFGVSLNDVNSLKIMRNSRLQRINFKFEPIGLESYMGFHLQGCRMIEFPIEVRQRTLGRSKISHKIIIRNLLESIKIKYDISNLIKK